MVNSLPLWLLPGALALGSCLALSAQTATSTPAQSAPPQTVPPKVGPGQATTPAQTPGAGVATLRANANLVVVDVVVNDSKQNPVHKLKPTDFTLLENGVPQQIKNFEEHSALTAAEAAKLEPMPKLPAGVFTNFSPAPANGTVNVLLLDSLNTPMKDQSFVRQQLLNYLKTAPAGTRIAIFGLTTHLIILQGFTSDPEILKAAVSGKAGPRGSVLLDDPAGGGGGSESMSDMLSDSGVGSDPSAAQMLANVQQFEAQQASFQLQLRATYTLDAMNQLARYLVSIPGRKNLIWFSGSFPLNILPDGDLSDPFSVVASSEEEYRETTNLLARSQVAVYPIDARGLMTNPVFSASNAGSGYARNPQAFAKASQKFSTDTANEHGTMYQMADDTGGKAFVNTNGIADAVAKAIESGSNYYTISYTPTNTKWNGLYRKIQVKLPQPGLTLSYRHGYYSDDPNAPTKRNQDSTAATAPTRSSTMSVALKRGGPDPTEIIFEVRVLPASLVTEDSVASGNVLNVDPKLKIKGPFRRYTLDFAADAHAIHFTPEANGQRCAIEFVTLVYDHDGSLINSYTKAVRGTVSPAAYAQAVHSGVSFHEEISVPVKGEYFLRTAIHDLETDRVGAVELPVAVVARLPPPAPAVTPPGK
jgi:VWFA-related protein